MPTPTQALIDGYNKRKAASAQFPPRITPSHIQDAMRRYEQVIEEACAEVEASCASCVGSKQKRSCGCDDGRLHLMKSLEGVLQLDGCCLMDRSWCDPTSKSRAWQLSPCEMWRLRSCAGSYIFARSWAAGCGCAITPHLPNDVWSGHCNPSTFHPGRSCTGSEFVCSKGWHAVTYSSIVYRIRSPDILANDKSF